MSLKRLTALVSPPEHPQGCPPDAVWRSVEAQLRLHLPNDYHELVMTYGTGRFDGFLWVLVPDSRNPHLNLMEKAHVQLQAWRALKEEFGEPIPYSLYPERDGLLPWALTDNGDVLHWQTGEDPENWRIVVADSRAADWDEYQLSTTQFLSSLLSREILPRAFPRDFPSARPMFTPWLVTPPSRSGR
jgi:hypothetical protein